MICLFCAPHLDDDDDDDDLRDSPRSVCVVFHLDDNYKLKETNSGLRKKKVVSFNHLRVSLFRRSKV